MKIRESLKTAIRSLRTNKIRSFLTMLGIVIGICAVVAVLSLGAGAQNLIVGQLMSMGSNNIFIEPGSFNPKKSSMMQSMTETMQIKTLKLSDARAIEDLPTVEMVAPMVMGTERTIYQDIDKKVTFLGTTPKAQSIEGTQIILGRNITEAEVDSQARVVLLGHGIKEDLFGDKNPIGESIRIKKTNFRVIGVLEKIGSQMFMNLDQYVYVPVTSAQNLLLGIDHLNAIIARADSEKVIEETVEEIRLLLRERHDIYNPEGDLSKDDFKVMSQVETANMLTTITGIFTLFLSSVAAIALVVGGIGIMNIMLVSVTERTREIGLRKAVGATKKDILGQFLLESIVLTIVGGGVGVILGVLLSFFGGIALGNILNTGWEFFVSFKAIGLGLGVAVVIGLIFGLYPAYKAAKLSPIEALRYQ